MPMLQYLKFALFFLFILSYGQNLDVLRKKSYEAYELGNYNAFKDLNLRMLKIHPSHPGVLFNTAISYGKLNQSDSLNYYLKKLISWDADLDFEPIMTLQFDKKDELIEDLKKYALAFKAKVSKSKAFLEFDGKHHFEDIMVDLDTIYFTDIHQKSIIRTWANNQAPDTLIKFDIPPMAMAMGNNRNIWVSLTNPFFNNTRYPQSYLVQIDIDSAKELHRVELPNSTLIGSMVCVDHTIFATDSSKPQIFVFDAKNGKIKTILKIEDAFNLQGIAYNPNNELLYIADYIKGLLTVEVESLKPLGWIISSDYLLKGLDGIAHVSGDNFIAVQNNASPLRVIKLTIKEKLATEIKVLENSFEPGGEPTNLAISEDKILFIANNPWPLYDEEKNPELESWPNPLLKYVPLD